MPNIDVFDIHPILNDDIPIRDEIELEKVLGGSAQGEHIRLGQSMAMLLVVLIGLSLVRPISAATAPAISPGSNSAPPMNAVRVTAPRLNVRAAPSTGAVIVGHLRAGDYVMPTGRSADGLWWQVQHAGQDAYIAVAYTAPAQMQAVPAGDPSAPRPITASRPGQGGHPTLADGTEAAPTKSGSAPILTWPTTIDAWPAARPVSSSGGPARQYWRGPRRPGGVGRQDAAVYIAGRRAAGAPGAGLDDERCVPQQSVLRMPGTSG